LFQMHAQHVKRNFQGMNPSCLIHFKTARPHLLLIPRRSARSMDAKAESARAQPDSPGVWSHHADAIQLDRALLNGATLGLSGSRTVVLHALCLDRAGRPWLIHKC